MALLAHTLGGGAPDGLLLLAPAAPFSGGTCWDPMSY